MDDKKRQVLEELSQIKRKLEIIVSSVNNRPPKSDYLTAQDIEEEFGINQRTILNRSNLPPTHDRFIPSLKMGGRRKYFERRVIDRLLKPSR